MIPVVIYSEGKIEQLVQFGMYPPSEIAALVNLIKENGLCIGDQGFAYVSSAYDLENKRYEIVVNEGW